MYIFIYHLRVRVKMEKKKKEGNRESLQSDKGSRKKSVQTIKMGGG